MPACALSGKQLAGMFDEDLDKDKDLNTDFLKVKKFFLEDFQEWPEDKKSFKIGSLVKVNMKFTALSNHQLDFLRKFLILNGL